MKKILNYIPFYKEENVELYLGDSIELLGKMKSNSIDMIFADPPYFLSNGGISCHSGKQVLVDKGDWDKGLSFNEKNSFNRKWIRRCYRVLKDNGTLWISGTLHNIYSIGYYLEKEGFKILNNITWEKTNPPPNLACRCFTHSTETILWAKKDLKNAKHTYNYLLMKEMNNGKQMKDVWKGSVTSKKEKEYDRTTISTEYSRRNTERRPMGTRTMRHLQRASTRTAHETNTYPKHQIQINICEEP